jgi:carbon storage regulator
MLILSRRCNQRIFIGENIVIQVTELHGDKVWIGITAPNDVRIYREEVLLAILARQRSENRADPELQEIVRARTPGEPS